MSSKKDNVKLTTDEIQFIVSHAVMPDWTDEKIAEHLGRSIAVVKKYRLKYGIAKGGNTGEVFIDGRKISKEAINKANIPDHEKVKLWREYLETTVLYKRLIDEFTDADLDFFAERWAEYHLQFDELRPTEESSIVKLVTLELQMSDSRKNYTKIKLEEERLMALIGGRDLADMEDDADRGLFEMMHSNNRLQQEITKDSRELNKNHEALLRELNATREQREQKERIGADTFINLVKILTSEDQRRKINEDNELMKMATQKKTKEFKQVHEFINGEKDRILLDGADYVKKDTK